MYEITSIGLSKLLKLEIPQLAKLVLEIVEKHDPESLLIEKAYNDFKLLEPEIDSLIVAYGAHPVTQQLVPLRKKRLLYATALSFQVRGLANGYIEGADDAVRVVNEAVNRYLYNLRGNNEEIINEKVDQFLNEINSSADLQNAISTLEFTSYIDNLTAAHIELKELLAIRNASLSKRAKGVLHISSKAVRNGLKVLFGRIIAASWDNKELNYKPLVDELNEKLIRYKGLIKMRETALKNSKKSSSSNSEGSTQTEMMSQMRVSSNDFDSNQDQTKTVAPSRKLMQLPPINNEA